MPVAQTFHEVNDAQSTCDVLILGAGAAGLMAARTAARRGLSVVVADSGPVPGRKVRIAGGGRGNFTNLHLGPEWYTGADPAFVKPALKAFPVRAALQLLESFGIPYEEREYGQIFGLVPAVRLVEGLVRDCREHGVRFCFRHEVTALHRSPDPETPLFSADCTTPEGPVCLTGRALVLAVGSPAWSDAGATDAGPRLLKSLGQTASAGHESHSAEPFRPALVPLILPQNWPLAGLQGVSAEVRLSLTPPEGRAVAFTLPLLFTHKGLSGPAALQVSCHWRPDTPLLLDFLPATDLKALMHAPENGSVTASALLRRHLPQRLADALFAETLRRLAAAKLTGPATERGVAQWSRAQRETLLATVHRFSVTPLRSEGMGKAEAAGGGLRTPQFNPRTMESRVIPGLFAAGEVLDITGALGGYNLHWAFASGLLAGNNAGGI